MNDMKNPPTLLHSSQRSSESVSASAAPPLLVHSDRTARPNLILQVNEALRASRHLQLRKLHVCAAEGLVILHGTVPTYYMKQIAQVAVLSVIGVTDVHNELIVASK